MLCCKRIITGLEGRQDSVLMTEYLKLYTSGDPINVARFAREAGTNRMMVYRKIAPLALAMVTEELECYNREHSGTG
jgi:hypothetical protein